MPYKVKVDRHSCIGSASCVAIAPNAFTLDDEGKSAVKKKDGSLSKDPVSFSEINEEQETTINAAKSCPVNAIIVIEIDEKGNEVRQVWPS